MSTKIRRYNANESDFNQNGRVRTQVDVPASAGFTDLTQSRLILDMHIDVTDPSNANAKIAYPATFGRRGQMVGAQSLIRNARVVSREHGLLNERRHQNVIDSNLDWYQRSRAAEDSASLLGNTVNKNYGHDAGSLLPDTPFLLYNRPGADGDSVTLAADRATTRRAEIPIDWKHIDQFANVNQFPNIALGELSYHLEFEDQINPVVPATLPCLAYHIEDVTSVASLIADAAGRALVTTRSRAEFVRPPMVGDQIELYFKQATGTGSAQIQRGVISSVSHDAGGGYALQIYGGIATAQAAELCSDMVMYVTNQQFLPNGVVLPYQGKDITTTASNLTIGSAANPIIIENLYGGSGAGKEVDYHLCPFYPGAPVQVNAYRETDEAIINAFDAIVDTLTIRGANLEIILESPVTSTNPQVVGDIRISMRDGTDTQLFDAAWVIDEVYLELHQLQLTPAQQEMARKALADLEIPWQEQRLVQKNMPATTTHTDVIELEPNCAGVAVLTPQNLELLSGFDNCTSYRFALDGKDVTNRDIVCGPPAGKQQTTTGRQLHNHMLKKYFANLGQNLLKYDADYYDYSVPDNARTHAFFPLVTPVLPRPQTMQIQMFSNNANMSSKNIHYVSTHERVLKLSNGRVMIQ